ncbi:MFS transporter [Demequina sp. SYSU T00068]|uniref:MFS transporter n=1 Tax=Demequina lignilytica TaxID=3051663 RepID=UPI00260B1F9A|nr:MFS transporter [Demequina sp. SYSU T00068]MDN4491195.1 MFS transporter [Demequina sp. SYSU T00068]
MTPTEPREPARASVDPDEAPELFTGAVSYPVAGEVAVVPAEVPARGEGTAPPVPRGRALAALLVLALSAFAFVTAEVLPLGLMTPMAEGLGVAESTVGLLITVQALVVVVGSVPLAFAVKRLRPRTALLMALTVFAGGLAVSATADSFGQLVAGRGVSALAHALFWAVVTPAAAGMFPQAVRGRMVSRLLLGGSGAGVIGLPASTWLAQQVGWHAPYWVLVAAAVALLAALAILMPGFRAEEGTAARGELPSRAMYVRVLVSIALAVGSMAVTWTFISPFLVRVTGFGQATVPALLALGGVVGTITTAFVGRYLDRWPVRSAVVGLALLVSMFAGLAVAGSNVPATLALLVLQGFAWAVAVPAHVNWAMRHAPGRTDVLMAGYQSLYNVGNMLGPIAGGAILAAYGPGWLPAASVALSGAAFLVVLTVRPWGLLERLRRERRRSARASVRTPRRSRTS